MANTKSAKKEAGRSIVRAARNRSIKSAVKTRVAKFRRAAVDGAGNLEELAAVAITSLDRAVSKGILHRNNAARRKSRLLRQINTENGKEAKSS